MRVKVDEVFNVAEMRERARRRLPRAVFDAIDGGAGDETSVRGNRAAFEKLWIRPKSLVDVSTRDLRTTVLGDEISLPVMLDPCGFARMCNYEGELAIARAAGAAGTIYAVSGASAYSMEEIKQASTGPTWYQWYPPLTQAESEEELHRIKAAGYRVLCVTVDSAINPIRDRDYYNRMVIPLTLTPTLIRHGLSRPAWSKEFLFGRVGQMWPDMVRVQIRDFARAISRVRAITLEEIIWMKEIFDGPIVLKGVMRGEGVSEMIDAGVNGIVVSNHGGRNLDGARPTIDILPEVVAAANGRAEVFMDGGVRRGTDVLKALALGARAVLIGRPYMFALGAYGEAGVQRVIEILRLELENAMGLAGCPTVADIDASVVIRDTPLPVPVPSGPASVPSPV
jgi:isopentenyl diphosphate isomerase/L-lactate dehydrogenase-like FMN-dependent dehydrogenase